MTSQQYLETLAKELRFLKSAEREDVIADYSEHFTMALASGETAERTIGKLGSPRSVAREYQRGKRVQRAETKPGFGSVAKAVCSVALKSAYHALVIAPLYIAGLLVLIALYVSSASIALAALAGVAALATGAEAALLGNVISLDYIQASFGMSDLAAALLMAACAAVGGELFLLARVFGRWFFKSMASLARKLNERKEKP